MIHEPSAGSGDPAMPDVWWRSLTSVLAFVAALLLIALVILVYTSNEKRDADHARERHSYEVLAVTHALGGAVESSEAALGRYVMSGDRQVGTRYYHEWLRAGATLDRLRRITADDPESAAMVQRLTKLYKLHGDALAGPATLANYKKGWQAISLFYKVGQASTGPDIRAILRNLANKERALLDQRALEAQRSAEKSNSMAALLSFLGIFLVLCTAGLGVTTVQAMAERHITRRNLRQETARAETLEQRVAERTRELEATNRKLRAEAGERAQAEATLRQVQKMEAVGQLTGGIAHDFNNMLAVVVGGLDLARRRIASSDAEATRHLDNAMEGAVRAAALTRRLLSFARAEPLLPEGVDAGTLITGMSELFDRTLGERIRIETDLGAGPWSVWIDPHQFENALLNLAVNARDAMNGEGTLRIETANVRIGPGEIGQARAGDYVRIVVKDTGEGMPREVLDRVFEPFFTTKPVGKGTGLGLSQVFGFARQSEGEVTVDSVLGEGTTVTLYLPRHSGEGRAVVRTVEKAVSAVVQASPSTGVVLVVEDDPRVRAATIAGLTELGYAPVPCATGPEALEMLGRREDVRLVVSDVIMPGMTGIELARRLGETRPGIPVLLVTGFVGDAAENEDLTGFDILRKPFTIAALSNAVNAALARKVSGPRLPPRAAATG